MTMHADQLVGAPVADCDGLTVGTVEQVFRDDVDETPSWVRIRSAKGFHFVPLLGSKINRHGGLCVPFESARILRVPRIGVDRHMSVEQEDLLRRHFGIAVPAQRSRAEARIRPARAEGARAEGARAEGARAEGARAEGDESGSEWVIRSEERIAVNLETRESGRVRIRKYVDAEPVQQTIRVFHEELDVERVPIAAGEQITGDMAECEQEVVLHEARAKITKETVPVERVRLSVRKVEEDKTVTGEIRKERIEVIDEGSDAQPPGP
jgi:uncharacterized protein (TIGR02271 family)